MSDLTALIERLERADGPGTKIFGMRRRLRKHQSARAMFREISPEVYRRTLARGHDLWPVWQRTNTPLGAGDWAMACIAARVMCAMGGLGEGLAALKARQAMEDADG